MSKTLQFSIDIVADKDVIWRTLWSELGYRAWASVFFAGAYAVTDDWLVGTKVHFLAPDQSGIYSMIEKHIPNKVMSFKHIGSVKEGKEQPLDDESKPWSGAKEIYKLEHGNYFYRLEVEIDVMEEHLEFMETTFPKALKKIKDQAELAAKQAK